MNANTKFWVKELKKLNGGVIERPVITPSQYEDEFFGLEIRLPNGKCKILWILRDEEGNGPGAVDIVNCDETGMEIIQVGIA